MLAHVTGLARQGSGMLAQGSDDEAGEEGDDYSSVENNLPDAVLALRAHMPQDTSLGDRLLEQALRVAKLDVKRAATVLSNLERFRREQDWALPLTLPTAATSACLRSGMHVILPPDREARPVLLYRASKLDPAQHSIEEYQRMGSYLMECITREQPEVQHRGVTLLVDLRDASLRVATSFSLADLQRGIGMWRDTFPAKLKRLIVVNAPLYLHGIVRTCLLMLRKKMRARVHVLKSQAHLAGFLEPRAVPIDLGGELPASYWSNWCDEHEKRFVVVGI